VQILWPKTELPQTKGLKGRRKAVSSELLANCERKAVSSELLANSERKTRSRFLAVVVVNISLFLEKFCDTLAARVIIIKSSFPEEPAARGASLGQWSPKHV
jgi:hypothetical protein